MTLTNHKSVTYVEWKLLVLGYAPRVDVDKLIEREPALMLLQFILLFPPLPLPLPLSILLS